MTNRIAFSSNGVPSTTQRTVNIATANADEARKTEQHIAIEIFNDYCSTSTLHGVSYIGAKDKSLVERIWWVVMFILSVVACSFLISKTWTKWNENPVIISFEKEQMPIWQIPFPAVTVCPVNKIIPSKFNYTEKFRNRDNLNEKDYKLFSDLSLVCNLDPYFVNVFNSTVNFTDESAIGSIRKMAPHETIHTVFYQNDPDSAAFFEEQLTEEGLCFSFNSFSQEDMFTDQINKNTIYINHNVMNDGWNVEDGFLPNLNMSTYPFRTAKDGRISGMSIFLFSNLTELDYVCGLPISGYKITLHNPAETPKVAEQYFLIPFNKIVSIIVRPELTKAENSFRSLPAHIRKCFFSNEKSLRFFKVYTQNNCRVECDANVTQHYCGCVPFHMPRDSKTRICGYGKIDCIREVESAILDFEVREKLSTALYGENKEKLEKNRDIFMKCDCLPSCSSLHYTAETSQTETHIDKSYLASGIMEKTYSSEFIKHLKAGTISISQVDIFFKEPQFLALHRSELYGPTDFLANCGGLLGLFMGFSFLSLVEIIYFLTIRLWFKYQIRRKHKM